MFSSIKNNSTSAITISDMGLDIGPGLEVDINSSMYAKLIDSDDIIQFLNSGDLSIIYGGSILDINNSVNFCSRKYTPFFRNLDTNQMQQVTPLFLGETIYVTDQNFTVTWNGTDWIKNDPLVFNPNPAGTGNPGTYTESFEDLTALNYWYTPVNFPIISNTLDSTTTGTWNLKSSDTPSGRTGPSAAQSGSRFIYAEVSSGANSYTYKLRTTNFSKPTNISFYYNLTGSNIGRLKLNVFRNSAWENKWDASVDTGTGWTNVNLDISNLNIEEIEFEYSGASGYQGDCCIDNVSITSV